MDGLLQRLLAAVRRITPDKNNLVVEKEYSKRSVHNTNPFFIETIQFTRISGSKSEQTGSPAVQKDNLPLRLESQLIINATDCPTESYPYNPKIPNHPLIIPTLANA